MAKLTVYGLPGVYNATPLSLNDGDGVALAVTSSGQLIVVNADGTAVGAGIEYTDGGIPPLHPKAPTLVWSDGSNWQTVSTAKPLPVSTTISGVATAANQINATQKTQIVDGSGNVIASTTNALNVNVQNTSLAVTGTFWQATQPISAASLPLPALAATSTKQSDGTQKTQIVDGSGNVVGSTSNALDINIKSGNPTSITANAGTNLNTSALALESGGNLATIGGAHISQEATTSGVKGLTIFGAVTTNAPTYTTLKSDALSLDTSGLLRVSLKDTPANTNKLLVTVDPITFASAQAVNATLQTQTDTVMVGGVNIKEINAVTPLMGNGITGTGSLRVTVASDNTAFAVNATLSAETTKVIGVVRTADGTGNLFTTNSTTYTAKFAQDINILGTLGTA